MYVKQQCIIRNNKTTLCCYPRHSFLIHYQTNFPNLHGSWNMGGNTLKDPLFPAVYILRLAGKKAPVPWPLNSYRELKTPWHIVGLSSCEVVVNLWSICRAHQKSWVLYIIGWDRGQSIPTSTGDLILYEWIKSHSHSYWITSTD